MARRVDAPRHGDRGRCRTHGISACLGTRRLLRRIPWTRRVALHRAVAERLEAARATPVLVAEHWVRGRRPEPARAALLAAAEASGAVHAYRDAERAVRRALELWPDGHDEAGRLDVLERLAGYAELAGDLAEAVPTWREVADGRRRDGDLSRLGIAHRRLAAVLELQGRWQEALASREQAAVAFTAAGLPADAAAERLGLGSSSPIGRQLPCCHRLAPDCRRAGAGGGPGRPSGPDHGA